MCRLNLNCIFLVKLLLMFDCMNLDSWTTRESGPK